MLAMTQGLGPQGKGLEVTSRGPVWYPDGKLTLLSCPWSGGKEGRPGPSWRLVIKAARDSKERLVWFFNFSEPQFPNL